MRQYIISVLCFVLSSCATTVHDKELQDYNTAFSDWSADPMRAIATPIDSGMQTAQLTWQPLDSQKPILHIDFAAYDTSLSDTAKITLETFLSNQKWPNGHFILKGYASEKGSRSVDMLLAWKRSYIVGQFLEQFGINHDSIIIQAYGKEMISNPDKYAKLRSKSVEVFYEEGN